nr:MAG TPA: hypothetical protein [Inoviridae sp.]
MDNVYKTRYHFYCDNCVCRYCAPVYCPAGRSCYEYDNDFCVRSRERGACPRYDCDFFRNRNCTPRKYIVVNRRRQEASARKALEELKKEVSRLCKIITDNQTK